jgi:hypothetical protein
MTGSRKLDRRKAGRHCSLRLRTNASDRFV